MSSHATRQKALRTDAAFGATTVPTLADVLLELNTKDGLTPRQRADYRSAVLSVARILGLPPESTPARLDLLRRQLERILPAAHGLSRQRWSVLRSQFATALRLAGFELLPGRFLSGATPEWASLREQLSTPTLRHRLSRFLHFCSAQGVAPCEVDDVVLARFRQALFEYSLVAKPERALQRTIVCWNTAVDTVNGWPSHRFAPPCSCDRYVLPLSAFPASFAAEVEAWLARLGGADPLAELDFYPVRPTTLKKRRFELRQLASALVRQGWAPDDITTLTVLVALKAAKEALSYVLERTGGRPSSHMASISSLLLSIGRHWVKVDQEDEAKLKALAKRCRPPQLGMTEKNRRMLRQFEDAHAIPRLLTLPAKVMREFSRIPPQRPWQVRRLELALAMELLLVAPMRLHNLAALDLERHFVRIGSGKTASLHLCLPADEVKNSVTLEFPLPPPTLQLLDFYLVKVRPLLACRGGTALFVGRDGGLRHKDALGKALSQFVSRAVGLRITAHQFRHLAGYLYLRLHPGDYETVRALLGHKNIETTIRYYAGMEGLAAARAYDAAVLRDRHG